MIINDVWGRIVVEKDYEKIVKCKEFTELKNKTQLGLNSNINVKYTRFQHSIGTYYLACKLIDICKNKFSNIISITKEDEWAVKCMALVHDLGHGCFSHVSEEILEGNHEDRTIEILLNPNSQIHQVIVDSFGNNVLNKIISLLNMKFISDNNYKDDGIMLIISKLLSGGIDIDRIDYLFRDSYYVLGEHNDYSKILENINLETVGDFLEIVFDEESEYTIANFFNKRFELYDKIYLENSTLLLVDIYGKFLDKTNILLNWDTSEIEMENKFRNYSNSDNIVIKRYAELLKNRKLDDDFVVKEINNKKTYENYKTKLLNSVLDLNKYKDCLFELNEKINIYNEDNKILINKSGLIKDISECSNIINTKMQKEKYIIGIDLFLLKELLKQDNVSNKEIEIIINKIKSAMSNEIEQERKYIFESQSCYYPDEIFKFIRKKLGMDLNLSYAKYVRNIDAYFDYDNILDSHNISVRKRVNDNIIEWTIKRDLNDSTAFLKREEINFASLEDVIDFLKNEWNIPINSLEEVITLNTFRAKYDLEYYGGVYEITFDKFIPVYDNAKHSTNYMIECELKEGSSAGMYFINKVISSYDFIKESRLSKKEIAINSVKEVSNKKVKKLVK